LQYKKLIVRWTKDNYQLRQNWCCLFRW
jgi:hypothetical protein